MTTEVRRYSEKQVELYRGVPADFDQLSEKLDLLNDLFQVAGDYSVGTGLIAMAHDRIDDAMVILAGAMAPWELQVVEEADRIEEAAV